MILHLKKDTDESTIRELAEKYKASVIQENGKTILVNSSKMKEIDAEDEPYIEENFVFDSDEQMASREYFDGKREIEVGDVKIGGETDNTVIMAGPCAVESKNQINKSAQLMEELGINIMRAGAYKPRTSPYSFQGLGLEGLKLLDHVREAYDLNIITEVRDATHIDNVIEYADIVQIGAKSMYDHGILRRCGQIRKPVLLKRGFGTTVQELIKASEFILSGGNDQVILCERGIRTFETKTRFTLDLCGAIHLKYNTNLPVVLDPSHAMGIRYGVPDIAKACMAAGVDGLLIETHPNPSEALSDAAQQLSHEDFKQLYKELQTIAKTVGRTVV